MTDYFWPQSIIPNSSSWSLIANTAAFTSPLTGATRTLGRGGDRWACELTFQNLTSDNRSVLQAFLAQLRGQANRVYVVDRSYRKRGTFPTANLLPDFASATPWTAAYCTVLVADGAARLVATAHTGAQYPGIARNSIAVTSGGHYAMRAFFTRSNTGTASMGPYLSSGTYTSSYSTAYGLKTAALAASAATADISIVLDGSGTSAATGDFCDVTYASLARCLKVAGSSQTGSVLTVQSTGGDTLLAGDRIEVNGEYHILAAPMTSTAASDPKIFLSRPLRSSPTDASPVIVHDPVCKMMLADNTVNWSNRPGNLSSMTVSLIEDIA